MFRKLSPWFALVILFVCSAPLIQGVETEAIANPQDVEEVAKEVDGQELAAEATDQVEPEAEEPVDAEPVLDKSLTPLEALRAALELGADGRYQALTLISPRGVNKADRAEMVKLLIPQLKSDYPDIRGRTADTLALFGPDAEPAIPELLKLVGDKEPQINLEAVWVPVSKALAAIGPAAIEPLMNAIPDSDRITYYGITASISEMGEAAKHTAPTFIDLVRNGAENRRWATIFTLSKLGPAAEPAIPDFIKNLDHENFNFQVISCRALAEHGAKSKEAVPKLLELVEKGILSSKTHAAMCLGAIGPVGDTDLVKLFTEMCKEENAFSQERGMIALGRLGLHAKSAAPFIEERIAKDNFSQKPEAARTLWQVTGDNKRPLEILESLIDNPTYDLRVLQVLTDMGPAALPMADELVKRLETDDQSLRLLLIDALVGMGEEAKQYLPAIKACLEDGSREVQFAVDHAVEKLGGE